MRQRRCGRRGREKGWENDIGENGRRTTTRERQRARYNYRSNTACNDVREHQTPSLLLPQENSTTIDFNDRRPSSFRLLSSFPGPSFVEVSSCGRFLISFMGSHAVFITQPDKSRIISFPSFLFTYIFFVPSLFNSFTKVLASLDDPGDVFIRDFCCEMKW